MRHLHALTAITLLACLWASATPAQQKTLKLATEGAYPPFNSVTADGKLQGFDIDIGNALCAEMKVTCEWVVQDWDGMIPSLVAGKFDAAVASMFITEERKAQVDFTDRYYRTPAAVAVARDSGIASVAPADLAGHTVGVQSSSVYLNYAEKLLGGSNIKAYGSVEDMLADLANGRLDAVNDDLIVIDQFLKSSQGACCKLLGAVAHDPSIHGEGAGIALRKGDPMVARFNTALKAIRDNGIYRKINDSYFSFDLYGD
jgi:polar amino acid transport system substrate-binding protein